MKAFLLSQNDKNTGNGLGLAAKEQRSRIAAAQFNFLWPWARRCKGGPATRQHPRAHQKGGQNRQGRIQTSRWPRAQTVQNGPLVGGRAPGPGWQRKAKPRENWPRAPPEGWLAASVRPRWPFAVWNLGSLRLTAEAEAEAELG